MKTEVIDTILQQYAEDAAFLWLLRDASIKQPHYDLSDLVELDDRVEAHFDGLRIAGEPGWEICKESLAMEEAGEVFVAAELAFESGEEKRVQTVLEAGSGDPDLARGLISALGWLEWPQAEKHVRNLADFDSPELRRIGLAACTIHRQNPGQLLVDSLASDDPLLRVRALKAVGELGRQDLLPQLHDNLSVEDEKCRFYAAWSTALLGGSGTLPVLRDIAESESEYSEKSCAMALRGMKLEDSHAWLRELSLKDECTRLAVQGAGVVGDPVSIPWLIEVMEVPELARVAAEAFSMITGVDLAYEDLEGEWPEGFKAGPTEEPEDEDVEMDPDEDLPWPEPELIAEWWNEKKGKFRTGTRYLVGKPVSSEHLLQILKTGYQRQRTAAALELAMLQPGQPLFEVRAPGFRQQEILGLK
ncbi:MAG: TIGR02270 family protein [Thermodesulfobacteriota bacterium]|nr:TIGR02270 family protein [Thermodesulfobacteriota bacterium]